MVFFLSFTFRTHKENRRLVFGEKKVNNENQTKRDLHSRAGSFEPGGDLFLGFLSFFHMSIAYGEGERENRKRKRKPVTATYVGIFPFLFRGRVVLLVCERKVAKRTATIRKNTNAPPLVFLHFPRNPSYGWN